MKKQEKIYAVGDIHGCYAKLVDLMNRIDIHHESDTLIFIGDYIDRGPDSFEVVDYLIELKKHVPHAIFLKGNHEELFEDYIAGESRLDYLINGGQKTLESYLHHRQKPDDFPIPDEHMEFFNSLRPYHETEEYIFVHAGLREKIPLEQQATEDLYWIRRKFIDSHHDFGKMIIFGHTPFQEPMVQPNKIGIDTGAAYGNKLTCVCLPEIKFYFA